MNARSLYRFVDGEALDKAIERLELEVDYLRRRKINPKVLGEYELSLREARAERTRRMRAVAP